MLRSKLIRFVRPTLLLAGFVLFAANTFAIGSGKSDEEKAADDKQKAVKVYNEGVEHMAKAKATAALGDSAFAYNYRATSDAKARKEFEKAADKFKDAAKLDPTMKEAFNNLGYSYRKLGKLEESLAAYQKALALDSSFARAREYLAETYLALDQFDHAEAQLAWLTTNKSSFADTLSNAMDMYRLREINDQLKKK